ERIRFVIRLKDGESMAALCREFGISRKTGYKIVDRYEECGLEGLTDRGFIIAVPFKEIGMKAPSSRAVVL
ncbi:MAG TPA: helix-turn-helix domain-containing protein, partial [Bryobacteraceae bacterium]|nr:helix-turn-helix domain-containing protein [Bryobacteraceae bacterium]